MAAQKQLVEKEHIGRLVSYYDEGWRVGTLVDVRRYGTHQKDLDGNVVSVGCATVRPLGTKYAQRAPNSVDVPIEDVRLEAIIGHTAPAPVVVGIDMAAPDTTDKTVQAPAPEPKPKTPRKPKAEKPPELYVGTSTPVAGDGPIDTVTAVAMYQAGKALPEIAAAVSTPDENGKTRVRRALKKAGVWHGAN